MSDIDIALSFAPKDSNLAMLGSSQRDHEALQRNIMEIVNFYVNRRTAWYPEYTKPTKLSLRMFTASAIRQSEHDLIIMIGSDNSYVARHLLVLQDEIEKAVKVLYPGITVEASISTEAPMHMTFHPSTVKEGEEDLLVDQTGISQLVTRLKINMHDGKVASDAFLTEHLVASEL